MCNWLVVDVDLLPARAYVRLVHSIIVLIWLRREESYKTKVTTRRFAALRCGRISNFTKKCEKQNKKTEGNKTYVSVVSSFPLKTNSCFTYLMM